MEKLSLFDYCRNELIEHLQQEGFSSYKVRQLFSWLYKKQIFALEKMSNLSKSFQAYLATEFAFETLALTKRQDSEDGTVKLLFATTDNQYVETVVMRHDYGNTVCVSSQIGCLMACRFCASGMLKKVRDLKAGEMVLQLLQAQQFIGQRIANVVLMGSGEPFDNYSQVMKFLDISNDDWGLAIGVRHITVSTCGLVPQIKQFAKEKPYNLAISLHGANNKLRDYLMPINKRYDLTQLKEALQEYNKQKSRRISLEYILLEGVNDSIKDVKDIRAFAKDIKNAYINLIPYNKVSECPFNGVSEIAALKFYDLLKKEGVAVTLRNRKGDDIDAACGQLRNRALKGDNQ